MLKQHLWFNTNELLTEEGQLKTGCLQTFIELSQFKVMCIGIESNGHGNDPAIQSFRNFFKNYFTNLGLADKLPIHIISKEELQEFLIGQNSTPNEQHFMSLSQESEEYKLIQNLKGSFFELSYEDYLNIPHWPRIATIQRQTKETSINVRVHLEGQGKYSIATGIGFFDHMLEQLAKHSGIDISIQCKGDLHIDVHHTVEDIALALGEALRKALGQKIGIQRYAFWLPMDESDIKATLDLSGRPYFKLSGSYSNDKVGEFPTEMVEHFFHSLCQTLGANLHIEVRGENTHHQVEGSFKAVAKSLGQAILRNKGQSIQSTKGVI